MASKGKVTSVSTKPKRVRKTDAHRELERKLAAIELASDDVKDGAGGAATQADKRPVLPDVRVWPEAIA